MSQCVSQFATIGVVVHDLAGIVGYLVRNGELAGASDDLLADDFSCGIGQRGILDLDCHGGVRGQGAGVLESDGPADGRPAATRLSNLYDRDYLVPDLATLDPADLGSIRDIALNDEDLTKSLLSPGGARQVEATPRATFRGLTMMRTLGP